MTRSVLIVDDSFLMRTVIRNIVSSDPNITILGEAVDGAEALDKVVELEPDVVLLDIEMPHMDGIEYLKRARLVSNAKVVVISSVTQLGSPLALQAYRLGANTVIPKPSGVLSMDLEQKRGADILQAIRDCA